MRCFFPRRYPTTRAYIRNKMWGMVHVLKERPREVGREF